MMTDSIINTSRLDSVNADSTVTHSVSLFSTIAPVPTTLSQTQLSFQLLKDLVLKHIYEESVASIRVLSRRLKLSGPNIESIVQLLRTEALIELGTATEDDGTLAFRLTDRGRSLAIAIMDRSGYVGPAPVSLAHYQKIVQAFSLAQHQVTRQEVAALFQNFIIEQHLADQLGAAFNSRKAIFVYGTAGTGKTFTIGRMMNLFKDICLVPHAIAVNDTIVQIYDPQIHIATETADSSDKIRYAEGYDSRFIPCQRPIVVAGGELTADLLEIQYDSRTKINQAPLQLKANNGILFIDDIGRQSIAPLVIFNRWIVPMEESRDFLTLANGQHFEVPFDVQLVFSSNIPPLQLADDAVLRRIGFKINFEEISAKAYGVIWQQECKKRNVNFDESVMRFALENLHQRHNIGLLPCHPRDLINMALTQATYLGEPGTLSAERIEWAWKNYFVQLDIESTSAS